MKKIAILAVCVTLAGVGAGAKETVKQSLTSVPVAEMPAKAADLVKVAKARDWGKTTVEVVKTAVGMNPAAAPAIVGAVAKAVPDMASVAAATAASEQPKQAAAIAKAAAAAAPSKAGKIAAAVCRAVPSDYQSIAVAVSQAAPGSNREVLQGVASALPDLKPAIEKSLEAADTAPQVAGTLEVAATQTKSAADTAPKGPTIAPPFLPISGPPVTISPNTTNEVPPGGRDYAKP